MGFDVFLQILRPLECFATEVTLVRLQRNVNSNMRGDVVALYGCGTAIGPSTSQVEVVCALAANVALTNMLLLPIRQKNLF